MTTEENLLKLRKLADAMYYAAQQLSTDASRLHKAMDEYHKFIIHECKKESKECMYSKDNYTDEDRKTLCDGCEEECEFNKKEEPVSEGFEEAIEQSFIYHENRGDDFRCDEQIETSYRYGFEAGANWQKQKDSIPVSEDLEQAIDTYLATYSGGDKEKQDWPFLKKMAIRFAEWQKQKMLANAVDAVVKIDAGGYPYVDRTIELYDYDKDIPLAKRGDKVKILVIKED